MKQNMNLLRRCWQFCKRKLYLHATRTTKTNHLTVFIWANLWEQAITVIYSLIFQLHINWTLAFTYHSYDNHDYKPKYKTLMKSYMIQAKMNI